MSYQGPLLIREPELRWPIVILAAIITALIALVVAGLYHAAMTQPVNSYSGPRLESALRPGEPEFEQVREQIEIAQLPPEALALGAHCSVEVVRAKDFGGPYLKPAA